ncbi:transglycosylase [Trichococcus palustris]|jgi:penicillin-binding protein 2A|uniref:Transglycosylase n=1 Tax=Trichococcus palustris TaxID=140314 RepID=A0A143YKF6_9LACT|nr:PBP1A family penicillin-binding protein [Trichococcus palustris]CZQ91914.1 transglycosylase [Trichococcus palustris]SFL04519.1 penicillin-binding protein 2A [Trichococcus palustris]
MQKIPFKEKLKALWVRFNEKRKNIWRKYRVNKIVVLILLIFTFASSSYLVFLAKTADVENLKAGLEQTSIVYDRYGNEAGELYSQKGTFVSIDQISANIQQAVVSTEDKRFYSHKGVDPIGIARAAVGFVIHGGNIVGGGSTITQQLAKNAYLSLDQTLIRKAKELFLAFEIENKYTKDEILEMYLNNAYFGSGVWGVEDASQKYFGKSASEVDLSEAAVLAGILKSPSYYNPIDGKDIDGKDVSKARRDTVLQLMADNKVIDQATADAAKAEKNVLKDTYAAESGYNYPYYFDAVIDEAINTYGLKEEDLLNRGYKIYTGLDQDYQMQMDDAYANASLPAAADGTPLQSASIALSPSTGDVLAVRGGTEYEGFRYYNRATQMKMAPGSTIKPLSVYTPALESGYKVDELLMDDDSLTYGDDAYSVQNYDKESLHGTVPMYQAIAESKNTSAVWLLDKLGIEKGIAKLNDFGITVGQEDNQLGAIALGGMSTGISPLQLASAYTTFANEGVRTKARFITKIVDATGAVIVDNTQPETKKVTTPEVADDMTSMLLGVYADGGTGASAQPSNGTVIAGKTGTTELDRETGLVKSQWMVGYTPDIVVASWLGYDKTDDTHNLSNAGRTMANLFSGEMGGMLSISPQTDFTVVAAKKASTDTTSGNGLIKGLNEFFQGLDSFGQKVGEGSKKIFDWANEKIGQ